jgi:(R,R)-butanediol dehydrogenase / meso-butanediol dehydrogenase / diacetyl reductase
MKAAVFHGPRHVTVEEVEKPKLLSGDVLVKITACGICGSDLHVYKHGLYAQTIGVPVASGFVLGHECSGEVAEISGEVDGLKVGDRVSFSFLGGNAEYIRVPAAQTGGLFHTPPDLSDEEAATCEPLTCSLCAVGRAAPEEGQTVVVIGLGVIGLGVVQVLKALHAMKTIIGIDLSDKRLAMARELGADGVLNPGSEGPYPKVLELTGSMPSTIEEWRASGVDIVFECAGLSREQAGPSPLQQALIMAKQSGKVMVLSVSERPVEIEANLIMSKSIRVIGSPGWGWTGDEFGQALELMRGKVDRKKLVTHEFSLDQAAKAYETQLNALESIKVLIKP